MALAALVLYFPATYLPIIEIQTWGQLREMTIWQGIVALANSDAWLVAIVVFLASIAVPFLKLAGIFTLCAASLWWPEQSQQWRKVAWRWLNHIGRWSMLDVFLLAILVALLRLGDIASAYPEPGSAFFTAVVVLTMLATATAERLALTSIRPARN